MSTEKFKYNLNISTKNNKTDKLYDATRNTGENRKILQAKRHGSYKHNRYINQPKSPNNASSSQGVKRIQSFENDDQSPPSKRSNMNYTPQKTMSYTPITNSAKNLAARRMENLRKSLEKVKKDHANKTPDSNTKKCPNIVSETPVSTDNERFKPNSLNFSHTHDYNSDGNFKRSRRYRSDDETSPNTSPVKHSSVQTRLENYKSCKYISGSVSSSSVQSPVCSSTLYAKTARRKEVKNASSIFNSNVRYTNSPDKSSNGSEESNCDTMEWTPIDEETIVENINELRKEINYDKLPVNDIKTNCDILTQVPFNDGVFIVVDTNIFLSQLTFISRLRDTSFTGFGRPVIVVPWMVIQELDYMKESSHHGALKKGARKAVHYINEQLSSKHPQFKGQTVLEASRQDLSSSNPDDGILFCSMQLAQQGKTVILLSNDVNLRSKALVNNLQAYSNSDIMNNIGNLNLNAQNTVTDTRPVQKIKILFSNLLTFIIEKEMQNAFGDLWLKMAMMHPPFTMEEALICLDKYWISVFSFSLQKQCKQKIEEFIIFIKNHRRGDNYQTADFIKFVEYTLSLCIYLKNGYLSYRHKIAECILSIQKCAE